MISNLNQKNRYLIFGILFGCFFPVASTIFQIFDDGLSLSIQSAIEVQKRHSLLWVIDTAPLFLGLFAFIAGYRHDQNILLTKKVESSLSFSKQLNESILSLQNFGAILCDPTGVILNFSTGASEITGFSPAEMNGISNARYLFEPNELKRLSVFHSTRLGKPVFAEFEAAIAGCSDGKMDEYETVWQSKDGSPISLSINIIKTKGHLGFEEGYLMLAFLQERQMLQKAVMAESELRISQILETMPVGVFVLDGNGKAIFANQMATEILGNGILPKAEISNLTSVYQAYKSGTDKIYPTEETPVYFALQGKSHSVDDMTIFRARDKIEIEVTGKPVFDKDGKLIYAVAAFNEITQRKAIQKSLEESEEIFRAIFNSAHVGILFCDGKGKIRKANKAFGRMASADVESLTGKEMIALVQEDSRKHLETAIYSTISSSGATQSLTLNFENEAGKKFPAQIILSSIHDGEKELLNLVAIVEDISPRLEAEANKNKYLEELKSLNDELNSFSGNLKELHGVLSTNFPTEFEQIEALLHAGNKVFGTEFGFLGEVKDPVIEIIATNFTSEAFHPGITYPISESFSIAVIANKKTVSIHDVSKDPEASKTEVYKKHQVQCYIGSPVYVNKEFYGIVIFASQKPLSKPFKNRDIEFIEVLGAAIGRLMLIRNNKLKILDTSAQLEKSNEDLRKSNEGLDQFAYVVSHDLKAPLRGINTLSEWIVEDLGEHATESVMEKFGQMKTRVLRLSNLINGILEYSRIGRTRTNKTEINSHHLLQEVIEFLGNEKKAEIILDKDLPALFADRTNLLMIFSNLVGNALKYVPDQNGKIEISCRKNIGFYEFCVKDNGRGIDARYHEKIFGVFQRLEAKDEVEGTGIGLAIVKKIVEENEGKVWLESEEGKGAAFWFTWPI